MVTARSATWVSVLLGTAILLLALSPLRVANEVEARAGALAAPLVGGVREVVRPVVDVLLRAGQIRELSAENAELRLRLATTEAELAAIREERTAVEAAAALIRAVGSQADQFTAASVILRDPAPGRQNLLLDRGRTHGIRPGQPVLGPGSTLIGIVAQVDESRARVRLITDRDSAVASVLQSSRTPGALTGTGQSLLLELVPVDIAVTPGDVVLSSALGGLLPPGLLIGRVATVETREQALFHIVTVDPLANLDRVEQVLVMTAFQPGLLLDGERR